MEFNERKWAAKKNLLQSQIETKEPISKDTKCDHIRKFKHFTFEDSEIENNNNTDNHQFETNQKVMDTSSKKERDRERERERERERVRERNKSGISLFSWKRRDSKNLATFGSIMITIWNEKLWYNKDQKKKGRHGVVFINLELLFGQKEEKRWVGGY